MEGYKLYMSSYTHCTRRLPYQRPQHVKRSCGYKTRIHQQGDIRGTEPRPQRQTDIPGATEDTGHIVQHGVALRLVLEQLHVRVEQISLRDMNLLGQYLQYSRGCVTHALWWATRRPDLVHELHHPRRDCGLPAVRGVQKLSFRDLPTTRLVKARMKKKLNLTLSPRTFLSSSSTYIWFAVPRLGTASSKEPPSMI